MNRKWFRVRSRAHEATATPNQFYASDPLVLGTSGLRGSALTA
jgi:hypothetical protein